MTSANTDVIRLWTTSATAYSGILRPGQKAYINDTQFITEVHRDYGGNYYETTSDLGQTLLTQDQSVSGHKDFVTGVGFNTYFNLSADTDDGTDSLDLHRVGSSYGRVRLYDINDEMRFRFHLVDQGGAKGFDIVDGNVRFLNSDNIGLQFTKGLGVYKTTVLYTSANEGLRVTSNDVESLLITSASVSAATDLIVGNGRMEFIRPGYPDTTSWVVSAASNSDLTFAGILSSPQLRIKDNTFSTMFSFHTGTGNFTLDSAGKIIWSGTAMDPAGPWNMELSASSNMVTVKTTEAGDNRIATFESSATTIYTDTYLDTKILYFQDDWVVSGTGGVQGTFNIQSLNASQKPDIRFKNMDGITQFTFNMDGTGQNTNMHTIGYVDAEQGYQFNGDPGLTSSFDPNSVSSMVVSGGIIISVS